LRAKFADLSRSDEALDPSMGTFLARAYETKDIHDYDSPRRVTVDEARDLLSRATEFIARIEKALDRPRGD
jgi:uncharacterized protein (UPF0332 family)